MIHYDLRCERGHAFESWFQSSAAYEQQEKRKLVNCPVCGSAKVERGHHGPADRQQEGAGHRRARVCRRYAGRPAPASAPMLMAQEREVRAKLRELRDHIVSSSDNVGRAVFPTKPARCIMAKSSIARSTARPRPTKRAP